MTAQQLFEQIKAKQSFLCVGLDTDITKIPEHLLTHDDPVYEFNRAIVDATAACTVCYKPNLAFYEAAGTRGWQSLMKTVSYIRDKYPKILLIADAKRGDIGNTSEMYARAFFTDMKVDAVTLSPYMGRDTVDPFLKYPGKWAVLLALTSNPSAADFETQELAEGGKLYEKVLKTSMQWGTPDNTMYVVGATKAEMLAGIRRIVPDHFLLVPGVGAQGGSLQEVAKYGMNARCGLLVNSSRAIIYADQTVHFAKVAGEKAREMQREMAALIANYELGNRK
jgi:orotidine-5'-phosphate decarboxylase